MEFKFGGKYRLEEEIANGGCGTVFLGTHHIAGKPVAIKLEPAGPPPELLQKHEDKRQRVQKSKSNPNFRGTKDSQNKPPKVPYLGPSPLTVESQIYKRLMGGPGVPWIMYSGRQGDYNVMVIDLLGPSLEDLFKMCNRCFSLKTVLLLTDQLLSRIEYIHTHSLLHRDIKPANFVMGTGKSEHLVNIIDFGLAKKFRDPRTSTHIPYKQDECHGVGTSLFAALNTHMGVESSRRDDIESLAYMLIYFLRGTLPWRKIRAPAKPPPGTPDFPPYNPVTVIWDLIRDAKLKAEATVTHGLPPEFDVLYRYARNLSFGDLPDYEGLRQMFRRLAERVGVEYDNVYDWTVPPPTGLQSNGSTPNLHAGGSHTRGSSLDSPNGATRSRFCEACQLKKRHAHEEKEKGASKRRR